MSSVSRRGFLAGAAGVAAATYVTTEAEADERRATTLRPIQLTTEHLTNPLGIGLRAPRLGWQLRGQGTDRRQTAYQVRVSRDNGVTAEKDDVWDSGQVQSSEQSAIEYAGPALEARTRYYWSVRVWDEAGLRGPWSRPARFETALPNESWQADWIGSGLVLPLPTRTLEPADYFDAAIEPGHELGQTFTVQGSMVAVAALLKVSVEAEITMSLREKGPQGDVIASDQLAVPTGEVQGRLDLPEPRGAGTYYLGIATSTADVIWQSQRGEEADGQDGSPYQGGVAMIDGQEDALADRWLYALPSDPPPNPLLRHVFTLDQRPVSARLYLLGLGHGRAMINGRRVAHEDLTPPFTDYDQRLLYVTHDVTRFLRQGDNAIGVSLGRGIFASRAPDSDGTNLLSWTSEPQLLAQLEVTLVDGRLVTIASGPDWKITEGPVLFDGLYTGETYDARRANQLGDWSKPSYDDAEWTLAKPMETPAGRPEPYANQPIRTQRTIKPIVVSEPEPGVRLYDFGEVLSGWVRFSGRADKGAKINILMHEKLNAEGRIEHGAAGGTQNPSVIGRLQRDEYIAAGGAVSWQPSWGHKSFQYVEISGVTEPLDVVAVPVRSDLDKAMRITVEQPVLQWIVDAAERTSLNGMHGHPDTSGLLKMGWLAQGQQADTTQLYGLDSAALLEKWLDDIRLGQGADGNIAVYTPMEPWPFLATPSTTATYPHLVHQYYRHHGDRTLPKRHLPAIRNYVDFMLANVDQQQGVAMDIFGDWYPPREDGYPNAPEGGTLVGTAYVIKTLRDAVVVAELGGAEDLAGAWRKRADKMITEFNQRFLDRTDGLYRTDQTQDYRQASNAIPLHLGLVPDDMVDRVARRLAQEVEANDRHLDTGSFGTIALPFALADHGHADLAHAVLTTETYPGYGFWRSLGATTFWEQWQAGARSHNDPTLSSPVGWILARVIGLETLEPGWSRFRVAPRALGDLPRAAVQLESPRGRIEARWERRRGKLVINVRVPVNATAQIVLPGGETYEVGSGRHRVEG